MPLTDADITHTYELFSALPNLRHRKMMGGLSIYSDDQIFAILSSDGRYFLKAEGTLADELAALGSEKFAMERKDGRVGTMGYWTLPDDALDDPELASAWGRKALDAQ
ncbi:MAG: TfoX/Sxy family protein [Shimia sp.]